MTKIARSFYSASVEHKEMPGLFLASFALPGVAASWVTDEFGKPKIFRNQLEAELAGFRVMAAKLNKSRDVQEYMVRRTAKQAIKTYHAPEDKRPNEPTVQ